MKYGFGWKRQKLDHRDLRYEAFPTDPTKSIDLRPQMPPVYDQGQTSSCVAHATAAAFQYSRMAQSLPNWIPSRLFIYWNARYYENATNVDGGSQIRDGVKGVANFGAIPEREWAFNPSLITAKPPASAYEDALHSRATQYAAVDQSLNHILSCLNHKLPVIFGTSVFQEFEGPKVATSGVVSMPGPDEAAIGGHAILIVGWKPETQHFIVRNSWGSNWGDNGYCYFPRDYILSPGLSSDFWVIYLTSRN